MSVDAMVSTPETGHPKVFSVPRLTTLIASVLVALCSGTNYVFSAYGPQLGSRLKINHTQLNIIGLAGNIGVYSSGPVWGRFVDSRGPQIPLAGSFLLLLTGYTGIRYFYDRGLTPQDTAIPGVTFALLVVCEFLSGSGGNAGVTSGINSTAKTFPDSARATTVGLVLAGFGLSAFLFSTISHIYFPGDTSTFLLMLALGTSFPMIMGIFLVRPIPLPPSARTQASQVPLLDGTVDAGSPLLGGDDIEGRAGHDDFDAEEGGEEVRRVSDASEVERRHTSNLDTYNRSMSRRRALLAGDVALTNVHGRGLAKSRDFWLLFSILSLLSGTGVMYINNVGSMSQALYSKEHPVYDDVQAAKWQATQVSTISIMSCVGRVSIGLICDYGKNKRGIPRSNFLVFVSFLYFISQLVTSRIESVKSLWIASALLGFAFGSTFSLLATVCIEWFGLPHFSENWGYLSMAPIFAGNLFSVVFGRNLDAHESRSHQEGIVSPPTSLNAPPRCVLGKECYVDTLYLTIAACFLAMIMSAWASWRDGKKMRKAAARE
ncbi:hypothetical protein AX15_003432 [Amanita polypyramis BW_CC]|nr:hypothetical protein AX15_003432 [Amanita polypyramis BW_CC]